MEYSFLHNLNIDTQSLLLLLMLPVIATIVGIARHVIGVKSLGLYAPIVLTYGFYALGLVGGKQDPIVGLKYGLFITTIIFLSTVLGTSLIKRWRMHYYPKVSIILSIVAMALIGVLVFAAEIGKTEFSTNNIFALILMASVAEQFTSSLAKNKLKTALIVTLETFSISILSYLLISLESFQKLILTYPYLLILTIIINYFVGRYRGLRIREYFRFRDILNTNPEEE